MQTCAKLDEVRVLILMCAELSLMSRTLTITDECAGNESGPWSLAVTDSRYTEPVYSRRTHIDTTRDVCEKSHD